jgi:hypothetical protein
MNPSDFLQTSDSHNLKIYLHLNFDRNVECLHGNYHLCLPCLIFSNPYPIRILVHYLCPLESPSYGPEDKNIRYGLKKIKKIRNFNPI